MDQAIQPSTAERKLADFSPSLENPAVALCTEAWLKVHAATLKQTGNVYTAKSCAGKAYRLAMPPLSGYQNICDFQTRTGPRQPPEPHPSTTFAATPKKEKD